MKISDQIWWKHSPHQRLHWIDVAFISKKSFWFSSFDASHQAMLQVKRCLKGHGVTLSSWPKKTSENIAESCWNFNIWGCFRREADPGFVSSYAAEKENVLERAMPLCHSLNHPWNDSNTFEGFRQFVCKWISPKRSTRLGTRAVASWLPACAPKAMMCAEVCIIYLTVLIGLTPKKAYKLIRSFHACGSGTVLNCQFHLLKGANDKSTWRKRRGTCIASMGASVPGWSCYLQ